MTMVPAWIRIASAIILVSLAVTGLAVASQEEEPPSFVLPRDGDRWTYAQQDFAGGNATDEAVARLFERVGAGQVLGPDGGFRGGSTVKEIQISASPCGTAVEVHVLAVATPSGSVGHQVQDGVSPGGCAQTAIITGVADPRDSIERYEVVDAEIVGSDPLPCGHTHSLAGGPAAQTIMAAGDCAGPLRLLGWDGGAAVYEDEAGQQVWFRPDAPVPTRIRQPMADGVRVLELVDFQPGREPIALAADSPGPGLAVKTSPGGRPAGNGFATQFPLEAALAEAGQDEAFARLLDRGHLVEAAYATVRVTGPEGDEIHRAWDLRASDGATARAITVRAVEKHDERGALLPVWDATREARTTIEVQPESWPDEGTFPAELPSHMPSIPDTIALWQALGGGQADAYAFSHACSDDNCSGVISRLTVGSVQGERELPDVVCISCVTKTAWNTDTLTVDAAGTVIERRHQEPVAVRQTSLATPPAPAPSDGGPAEARPLADAPFVPPSVAAGLTIAALLAGAGYVVFTLTKSGAVALWHRPVNDHPVRQQIIGMVERQPGIHHKELIRRLGGGNHVVTHHVRRLVAAEQVVAHAGTRYTCYFPKGKVDRHVMAAAPVLKADVAHRMLRAIAKDPGRSGKELAEQLGVVPGSITFHAKRMAAAGLIETERAGRSMAYRLTGLGEQALRAGVASSKAA